MELEKKKLELTATLDSQEEEVDKLETQLRYMRGELKNVFELKVMAENIQAIEKSKGTVCTSKLTLVTSQLKSMYTLHGAHFVMIFVSTFYLAYAGSLTYHITLVATTSILASLLFTMALHRVTPIHYRAYRDANDVYVAKLNNYDADIKRIQDDVKRTETSNDFISKYIDSI